VEVRAADAAVEAEQNAADNAASRGIPAFPAAAFRCCSPESAQAPTLADVAGVEAPVVTEGQAGEAEDAADRAVSMAARSSKVRLW
jgi:hypothetical protein